MFKRMSNNKGWFLAGPALAVFCCIVGGVTIRIAQHAQSGQLKKDGKSVWAHMQGKCSGVSPDSACITRSGDVTTVSQDTSIFK